MRAPEPSSPQPSPVDTSAALLHIAEESRRLCGLARGHGLAMLDYLIGMVVLEAEQEIRRASVRRVPPPPRPDLSEAAGSDGPA